MVVRAARARVRLAGEFIVIESVAVREQAIQVDVRVFQTRVERIEPVLLGEIAAENVLTRRCELAFERHEFVVHFGDVLARSAARGFDAQARAIDDLDDFFLQIGALLEIVRLRIVVVVHEPVKIA